MEGSGLMGAGIGVGAAGKEADNMIQRLQKALELEETDRDTLHLLTFLLMQFLAQPQHVSIDKVQTNIIVLNSVKWHY